MQNDLEIRHCRVLVAVSDHGTVSAAAKELKLAQSTISETLLALERVIGAPIMRRRPGKEAALTATAETLLPHARALIAASEAALASLTNENRGIIRLGAVESVSSYILPRALAAFRSSWPSVELQINIGLCDNLLERVRQAELDAVLTLEASEAAPTRDDIFRRTLAQFELSLIVSKQPPRIGQLKRADLAGRTFLLPDPSGAFPSLLRAWFAGSINRPRFESAGSIDGVKSGVLNSELIGVLPLYAVKDELRLGSLFALRMSDTVPSVSVGLTMQRTPVAGSPFQHLILQIESAVDAT